MAKKLLCLCLTFVMLFIMSVPGMAYTIHDDAVSVTKSDGVYTVVISDPVYANADVSITAVANGSDIPKSMADAKVAYFNAKKANADGEVTFTFKPKADFDNSKGLYVAVSTERGVDTVIKRAEMSVEIISAKGTVIPMVEKIYEGDNVGFKVDADYGYIATKATVNGVEIDDVVDSGFIVESVTKNLQIIVEYSPVAAEVSAASVFSNTINVDEFAEKYGEDMTAEAKEAQYAAVIFARISSPDYECGIVYSKNNENPEVGSQGSIVNKAKNIGANGSFGIYLYSDKEDNTPYFVRTFIKSGDEYIYGTGSTFTLGEVTANPVE